MDDISVSETLHEVNDATRLPHATRVIDFDASRICKATRQEKIVYSRLWSFNKLQQPQQKLITIMKLRSIPSFKANFGRLLIAFAPLRPLNSIIATCAGSRNDFSKSGTSVHRPFSSTAINSGDWLLPTQPEKKRSRKGRPRVPTGGSARGTTIVWGDYGLRMCDHHRRVSAAQLKNGEEAIKIRLKGTRYRLFKRVCASIGVYSSGNEVSHSYRLLCSSIDFITGPYGERKGFIRSLGV